MFFCPACFEEASGTGGKKDGLKHVLTHAVEMETECFQIKCGGEKIVVVKNLGVTSR